jgi:hypothetical protein
MDSIKIPHSVLYSGEAEKTMLDFFKYHPSYYMTKYNDEWFVSKADSEFFFVLVKGDFSNKRTIDTFEMYIKNKKVLPLREAYEKYKPFEFSQNPGKIKDCVIERRISQASPDYKLVTFKSW